MSETSNLYTYRYPHPAVTTDCVIFTFHEDQLKVLLIRRGIEPFKGQWALPGGFMRIDESAEECAHRELREETGVTGCPIKQFHTFSRPDRDPRERVLTIAFYALVKWQEAKGADDAEFADWIPLDKLPDLAFDHAEIIQGALEAIRRDLFFEPVGFNLLNDLFSMPQLQTVYEAILKKSFDRRNFAKKMKHLGILEEASAEENAQAHKELNRDRAIMHLKASLADASTPNEGFIMHNAMPMLKHTSEPAANVPEKNNSETGFFGFDNHSWNPATEEFMVMREENHIPLEKKKRGRRSSFFRLNRKKYDELKDENTIEF